MFMKKLKMRLKNLFKAFICWGDTGASKSLNTKNIIKKNNLSNPIFIGDKYGIQKEAKALTWDINRFPVYFRNRTRVDIEETAYVNIVPFRYIKAPSKRVYEIAFNNFTNELISIIQPHQIIPLGK